MPSSKQIPIIQRQHFYPLTPSLSSERLCCTHNGGRDGWDRQSDSSALECGHFRVMGNQVCCNWNLFKGLQPSS